MRPYLLFLLYFLFSVPCVLCFQPYSGASTRLHSLQRGARFDKSVHHGKERVMNKEIENRSIEPINENIDTTKPWFKHTVIKIIGNSLMFIGLTVIPLAVNCEMTL